VTLKTTDEAASSALSPFGRRSRIMRRKEQPAHISLGSLVAMVGLLATGTFSVANAQGTWASRADMPTGRWEMATSVVDGRIYAVGGAGPIYQALRTVEVYNPATDTWTSKSDMPTARQGLTTSVVNERIYAIGGGSAYSSAYATAETFSTVEEYDPATDVWTSKSEMPTARGWHSASVVDGRIYIVGGTSSTPNNGTAILAVEVYEPATDTWIQKGDIPARRDAGCTSVVDGRIYAFGGYSNGQSVHEYDPLTDTWTRKADMPIGRYGAYTSVVDGKIYAIAGHRGSSPYPGIAAVDVYDPATDTWTTAPDMPTGRFGSDTSVVDGSIYAFGGMARWIGTALGTVEEYDPARTVEVNPATAVAGQPTPLEVTVVLGRPLEETETWRRMILDLSPLGIPDDFPLEQVGGGRYTASTAVTPPRSGYLDLPILVETTEGEQQQFLGVTLEVYPGEDLRILDDDLDPAWTVLASSRVVVLSTVFADRTCQELDAQKTLWRVDYIHDAPTELLGYNALEVTIHPGNLASSDKPILQITINNRVVVDLLDEAAPQPLDANRTQWQQITIPLGDFRWDPVTSIRLTGRVTGTFYLDKMRLAAPEAGPGITAVLEGQEDALPQGFALHPSFPNPFNSSTTIRFSLAQPEKVALTIYNLAGQEAATLAHGQREAGTYTLRWDGRDGAKRELASGVYLYRLQAGEQMETRKLLLLR
jgi:N-acetylneuraminic acid mutarotase